MSYILNFDSLLPSQLVVEIVKTKVATKVKIFVPVLGGNSVTLFTFILTIATTHLNFGVNPKFLTY